MAGRARLAKADSLHKGIQVVGSEQTGIAEYLLEGHFMAFASAQPFKRTGHFA
jgi:hypothetical protein